jgi:hypothetical protein
MWLLADSPLTSTSIYLGYTHESDIKKALDDGKLTNEWKDYLISPKNYLDMKIAVINAIGTEDADSLKEFFSYLLTKGEYKNFDDFLNKANGDMLVVTAYLMAVANYNDDNDLKEALKIAAMGKDKLPKSYTANIVYALIKAQRAFGGDWCEVYNTTNSVRNNKTLNQDMLSGSVKEIFDYMDLYKDNCH